MNINRKQVLSKEEAIELHHKTLVIDSQQPPATSGFLFNNNMKIKLNELEQKGYKRNQASGILASMAAMEIHKDSNAKKEYLDLWDKAGVNICSATYAGPPVGLKDVDGAFESAVKGIAQARGIIDSLDGELKLILTANDIEETYEEGKRGLILDFQDTLAFGINLDRVDMFYHLGLRVVQLTYNLSNFVGDGCTELTKSGLTYFGKSMVEKLNSLNMAVDVSHCSQQVGWDALDVSSEPIIITHSNSNTIAKHDRAKDDDLAKAVADAGGFFGVTIVPGFMQENEHLGTLDDFAIQVEHLVNVMGIDHVGIGSDICGNGPETGSMIEYPESMPGTIGEQRRNPDIFDWSGFREEHRISDEYRIKDFKNFGDWSNLTVKLAEKGFNEEELIKILGLNYLRYFKEVIG
jgi:membrane dipeptidase